MKKTFINYRVLWLLLPLLILFNTSTWGAGAISVSTAMKVYPLGSTTVSQGNWKSAGAPTAYPTSATDKTINSDGSFTFYNAADYDNNASNYLQLKASGGYIETTITSPAGVDVIIGYKTGNSNNLNITLGSATAQNIHNTSYTTTIISTSETSATLKIYKNTSNAAYISFIAIIPKQAGGSGDYVLVESAGDIGPGKYLLVYNNATAMNTHYGNTDANTYSTTSSISSYYSNKTITANATTNALAYEIVTSPHGYVIKKSSENSFLGFNSTAQNPTGSYLRWDTKYTDSYNEWTLGVNSIVSYFNSSYAIRYNSGSPRFAIYTTSGQSAVQLFKKVDAAACSDPTGLNKGTITSRGATLSVTSSAANYDFYCTTSSGTPASNVTPTATASSAQSAIVNTLNYGTTYYYWARQNCGGGSTSSWVAGSGSTFTTSAPNTGLSITAGSLKPTQATFTIGDSNSPKINTYGGSYDIYYSDSETAPTSGTSATTNVSTLSYTATGLTAGTTYYYWVRGHGANANSSWVSGGNFTTPTLSSITVKTEPTTTTYFAGQTFSPTGLVITLHYSNSSTDDVAYSGNEGSFSFDPTTSTALTTSDEAVTITYGGKTVDQAINVYSVTVTKVDEDGETISAAGVSASWTVGTKALAASATAGSKYVFKEWAFDGSNNGLSITSTSSANTTVTGTPTGNVTIKAVFYKPRVVKWSVNGNDSYNTGGPTSTIAYHKEWSDLSLPTDPTPPCGDKFVGWTRTDIGSTGLDKDDDSAAITALDLMTSANQSSKTGSGHYIDDETVTFYAVFADYTTE